MLVYATAPMAKAKDTCQMLKPQEKLTPEKITATCQQNKGEKQMRVRANAQMVL